MSIKPSKASFSIESCTFCDASGVLARSKVINYHDYYEEEYYVLCGDCDGDGRVLKIAKSYSIELEDGYRETITRSEKHKLAGKTTTDIYKVEND